MPIHDTSDPWPRIRGVVNAVVSSLRCGNFVEETLESLCVQLGATSAWSTLEAKGGGRIHRSRTSKQDVSPAVLAEHVTKVLAEVQSGRDTVSGRISYMDRGSFIAVPLWSHPAGENRELIGSLYLEFADDQGEREAIRDFLECVGSILGGAIVQQSLIEAKDEEVLVARSRQRTDEPYRLGELLSFESMRSVRDELGVALLAETPIMLLGESGTGKTQLATAFARASGREPIVRATLGRADDLNTITSELFGHERGAFSGAVSKRKGLVEYADGGTLILDEVLALPHHAQQLLLDFTQFGSYRPLGYQGGEPKRARVRLISVTNGDVHKAIEEQRFREDLYFRLATLPMTVPPLRQRRQDISRIAAAYLNATDARATWELDDEASELLSSPRWEWRGNIRELEAVVERARNRVRAEAGQDPVIEVRHLDLDREATAFRGTTESKFPKTLREKWRHLSSQKNDLEAVEKALIEEALAACGGVVLRTARELDVSRSGLISRMSKLRIDTQRFKTKGR